MNYEELLTQIYKMSPDQLKRPVLIHLTEDDKYVRAKVFKPNGDPDDDSPYLVV